MHQKSKKESKVLKQQPLFEGKWLGLKYTTYSIGDRIVPNFQTVYRPTTKNKGLPYDGVEVIPVIKYADPSKFKQVVLIANFRAPANSFVLEFPSGLIQNQNYEQNARRQVLQQTGYVIKDFIKIPYPKMHCDPWKSNESGLFYLGIVDGDDPNSLKEQELENEQNIIVHKLPLDENLINNVHKLAQENKYVLEGKVWSICLGLAMMNLLK